MNIAQTILNQLGGRQFIVMTGAKQFGHTDNSLQFRLPARFARDGINLVKVTLNASDLYDVVYYRARGVSLVEVAGSGDLYADMLCDDFTTTTGLDTVMPTLMRA